MTYHADPGGNFGSDVHRRVCGHLPYSDEAPVAVGDLAERIDPDEHTPLYADDTHDLEDVLKDLEADGDALANDKGWRMSKAGYDKLSGPVAAGE